jgi:Spy/CpxP family protein refolding chaperone
MMNVRLVAIVALLAGTVVVAQEHRGHGQPGYAGLQKRSVKALSEQQLGDLRAGRGMGLALAAELNGYPGPMHVLELAAQLGLSANQRQRVEALYAEMKREATKAGEKLIEQETALDREFADRTITRESLVALAAQIGATQAELRATHLKYHLVTAEILTQEQVRRYAALRGYR